MLSLHHRPSKKGIWRRSPVFRPRREISSIALICFWSAVAPAAAEVFLVNDQSAYEVVVERVQPGDEIVLANGEWSDFQIVFEATGTEDRPITLRAETPGDVKITGQSNLKIAGEHLVVSGLTFTDGYSPSKEVVSFRTSDTSYANNVRFTNNVIDAFNKPQRADQDHWIALFGKSNRVDHNAIQGKTNKGMTVVVRLDNPESEQNGHIIERNYFGPRDPLGGNGGETIRIGTSFTSRVHSGTIVRQNYFEHCDGEVEIISIKSERNLVTENVFFESRGSVVFRHGGHNEVSRNVFLGNGVPDTGGIRVINDNQIVRDNYLEGLRGQKFNGALVVMNGVPNSPQNRYHQVENAQITGNTFVDVAHIGLGVGTDDERSAVPIESAMSGNLFVSNTGSQVGIFDDMSGISFAGNLSNHESFQKISTKSVRSDQLSRRDNGLLAPISVSGGGRVGAPNDLTAIGRDDVGPSFFSKPDRIPNASSSVRISASAGALIDAIAVAAPGDTIILPRRMISVASPITIDKPIRIKGTKGFRPSKLASSENGLFRVVAGGSLRLVDVTVIQNSSDAAVIHAAGETYKGAYTLDLSNVTAVAGDTLESVAPLIGADAETFASRMSIDGLTVKNWSGDVISLSAAGSEGWYLSDYISIKNSDFSDVSGVLIDFGRDGRDESTFGPRFSLTNSSLSGVGQGSAALKLPGIDGVIIQQNSFRKVGPIDVKRRVLGYPFEISENTADANAELTVINVDGTPFSYDFASGIQ
ncbi:MAG: polysaccharide lyase 6 family protein [Pseudomonadota bacterium]